MVGLVTACRSCGGRLTVTMADLGMQPASNAFIASLDAVREEKRYPLRAKVCEILRIDIEGTLDRKILPADILVEMNCVARKILEHHDSVVRWNQKRRSIFVKKLGPKKVARIFRRRTKMFRPCPPKKPHSHRKKQDQESVKACSLAPKRCG